MGQVKIKCRQVFFQIHLPKWASDHCLCEKYLMTVNVEKTLFLFHIISYKKKKEQILNIGLKTRCIIMPLEKTIFIQKLPEGQMMKQIVEACPYATPDTRISFHWPSRAGGILSFAILLAKTKNLLARKK